MHIDFDDIPEAKPAFELIAGQLVQKMSPKRRHARLQGAFQRAIQAWAGEGADVLTEWRCRISDGEKRFALVPDVAYFASARLARYAEEDREEPPSAPDIAVEVLSPGDSRRLLKLKIAAYLCAGSKLVLIVDPLRRTVVAHDPSGERPFKEAETVRTPDLPGLELDLAKIFSVLDRRP